MRFGVIYDPSAWATSGRAIMAERKSEGLAFADRYGPWAIVTGGSEGVGAAWASAIAARGIGLVLVARRPGPLEECASMLRDRGADVRTISLDVAAPDMVEKLRTVTDDLEIGLLIHNVGAVSTRKHTWFLDEELADIEGVITLNTLSTARLVFAYAAGMRDRRRGGIVVVGSLSGMAGQPLEAAYSAGKAFGQVFCEAMWCELHEHGVDVVSVPLGGTRTPGLAKAGLKIDPNVIPTAEEIVDEAIDHLQDGPVFVPNDKNRAFFDKVTRLPRREAAETMARLAYRVAQQTS
jgi:short-subunit dehydrogenase